MYKRVMILGILTVLTLSAGVLFGQKPAGKYIGEYYACAVYDSLEQNHAAQTSKKYLLTKEETAIGFEYFTAFSSGCLAADPLQIIGAVYTMDAAAKPKTISREGFSFWSLMVPAGRTGPSASVKIPADVYGADRTYHAGHLVPAHDMAFSRSAMQDTFCYYNTVPMVPELNVGPWRELEADLSKYAEAHPEIRMVVVVGAVYLDVPQTADVPDLAARKITSKDGSVSIRVPAYCYKIILLEDKTGGHFPGGTTYAVIAYKMPNTKDVKGHKASEFIVPLKELSREYPRIISIPWQYSLELTKPLW